MAFNLAAAATPVASFAAAGVSAAENPFADALAEKQDPLRTAPGVPKDLFGEFLAEDEEAGGAPGAAAAGVPADLTEDEEKWIQQQLEDDERRRVLETSGMPFLKVSEEELENEITHWLNAMEPEPGSAPVTPRSIQRPQPTFEAKFIDIADELGRAVLKEEFAEVYGQQGEAHFQRAEHVAATGILWEVVAEGGAAWRDAPEAGVEHIILGAAASPDIVADGVTGTVQQIQDGWVRDEATDRWLAMRDPSTKARAVILREAQPRRRAGGDPVPYMPAEFKEYYGDAWESEWKKAAPEVQKSAFEKEVDLRRLKNQLAELERRKAAVKAQKAK